MNNKIAAITAVATLIISVVIAAAKFAVGKELLEIAEQTD